MLAQTQYLAGIDPEKLVRASAIVNTGFDVPIKDIAFGPKPG
jgi:hypothetical protein